LNFYLHDVLTGGKLVEANPKVNLVNLSPAIDDDGFVLTGRLSPLHFMRSIAKRTVLIDCLLVLMKITIMV
jgi:hypothetical protein